MSDARLAHTQEHAAELLDVGEGTIRGLIRSGKLRTVRVGRHDRVPHSELERYVADRLDEQQHLRSA